MENYIEIIRDERKKQKISQRDMAEVLKMSLPSYNRIEKGGHCSIQNYITICNHLGITLTVIRDQYLLTKRQ